MFLSFQRPSVLLSFVVRYLSFWHFLFISFFQYFCLSLFITLSVYISYFINPIRTGGGVESIPLPTVFCPLLKKVFLQPIPEISWLFPKFWLRIPLWNFFFEKFCFHPLTALLGHAVQIYFFVFCFNQKNLFTKPSWNNF